MGERRSLRLSDIMNLETQELIDPILGTIYYNGIRVEGQPTFDMSGPSFEFTLENGIGEGEIFIGEDTIPIENSNGDEEFNEMEIEFPLPNRPSIPPSYMSNRNDKRRGMGGSRKRKTGRRKKRTSRRNKRTTRRKKRTR
jgi:hypothetical protein